VDFDVRCFDCVARSLGVAKEEKPSEPSAFDVTLPISSAFVLEDA
jgi:hypothetical protein